MNLTKITLSILAIGVCLIASSRLLAQTLPWCIAKPATYDKPYDLHKVESGGYLVASEGGSGLAGSMDTVFLEMVSEQGALLWRGKYPKRRPTDLRIHAYANVYLVTGKEISNEGMITARPFLLLFDQQGQLVFEKSYEEVFINHTNVAISTLTGDDYAFIGINKEILRIDATGNEQSILNLEDILGPTNYSIRYFYQDQAGNWVILSNRTILRVDPDNTLLSSVSIAYDLQGLNIKDVVHDENDRLYLVGNINHYPNQNEYWHCTVFTATGAQIWSRDYDIPFTRNGNLWSVLRAAGSIYLFGNTFRIESFQYEYYPLIVKLDDVGLASWYYELPFSAFTYSAMDIVKEADRFGFTITGHYECEQASGYDIYLQRVDIPSEDLVVTTDDVVADSPIRVYPNPTSDLVFVHCEEAHILEVLVMDTNGRLLRKVSSKGDNLTQVDLSGLPDQLLFLKIVQKGRETVVKKIVKQRG